MKTRVTFRIADDLAGALRDLPNQTRFVEEALRNALGRTCPVCAGSGRVPMQSLKVTNIRAAGLPALTKGEALQLKRIFQLGLELAATNIELQRNGRELRYQMTRANSQLFDGTLTPTTNWSTS